MSDVVNQGRTDFEFEMSEHGPKIIKTTLSNIVCTHIITETLKVIKRVDKEATYVFDELTYTIEITNLNENVIENVFFQDPLCENIRFINNTVFIDNNEQRCQSPTVGFYIGEIKPTQTITISFKVLVLPGFEEKTITNISQIVFDYTYNIFEPPARIKIYSNKTTSYISNRLFKQFNIIHTIKLSMDLPAIDCVESLKLSLKIDKVKFCETIIINTDDTNKLTPLNMIVIGTAQYDIRYKPIVSVCGHNQEVLESSMISLCTKNGFSVSLLVPDDICLYEGDDFISMITENLSYILINPNQIYISSATLLELK